MNYTEKIDYSSLSTYMECPRKFLFQYIFHFRRGKNIHLVFGSCWHYGKEVVYQHIQAGEKLTVKQVTQIAVKAFNNLWAIEGAKTWPNEDIIFPKSPGHAANVYYKYFTRYLEEDQKHQILAIEAPFALDLSQHTPDLPNYIGRLDLVQLKKRYNSLLITDHKTTKAVNQSTLPGFEMSLQTAGYMIAGFMYYDRIPEMMYNIAMFQKTAIKFQRYTINKRKLELEHYFEDICYNVQNILIDLLTLEEDYESCTKRNDIIKSFRRNPGYACTSYFTTCEYKNICSMRNNPLLWKANPPKGFIVNEWDPDTHEADMKKKLKEVA
jgi:hypothetical protein